MSIILHPDAHLDHLESTKQREAVLPWVLNHPYFDELDLSKVHVVTLHGSPEPMWCDLYGPAMGDPPIAESDVVYRIRGARRCTSRMLFQPQHGARPRRRSDIVTVVVGPVDRHDFTRSGRPTKQLGVFTLYGGPAAPREPGDTTIGSWEELVAAREFWTQHALVG